MTLREYRKSRKISQVKAAQALDVVQSTLSRWETGEDKPSRAAAKRIETWSRGRVKMTDWDE